MRRRYALALAFLVSVPLAAAQTAPAVPAPWVSADVGAPAGEGTSVFDDDTFTVTGGGDIWGAADAFHLVSRALDEDATLTARVAGLSDEPDWAKAGLVVRASDEPGAPYVGVVVSNLGVHFQVRTEADTETDGPTDVFGVAAPTWLRLEREGTSVTASYSDDGETWTELDAAEVDDLDEDLVAGLAVSAADFTEGKTATADFTDVSLIGANGNPVSTEGARPEAGFRIEAIAPNPASGQATARVRTERPGVVVVDVFDLLGRRVVSRRAAVSAGVSDVRLPIDAVPPGAYVVRLTDEALGTVATQRLTVLR